MSKNQEPPSKQGGRVKPPASTIERDAFVADAFLEALRARDVRRVLNIAGIAAQLVQIDVERALRRSRAPKTKRTAS